MGQTQERAWEQFVANNDWQESLYPAKDDATSLWQIRFFPLGEAAGWDIYVYSPDRPNPRASREYPCINLLGYDGTQYTVNMNNIESVRVVQCINPTSEGE